MSRLKLLGLICFATPVVVTSGPELYCDAHGNASPGTFVFLRKGAKVTTPESPETITSVVRVRDNNNPSDV